HTAYRLMWKPICSPGIVLACSISTQKSENETRRYSSSYRCHCKWSASHCCRRRRSRKRRRPDRLRPTGHHRNHRSYGRALFRVTVRTMSDEIADRLELPMMVSHNQDVRQTAYTVTVDAAQGVTTGISAADRAHTVNLLAGADTLPSQLNRPGHILPLRAVAGGVRQRPGHTEAAVELMSLAGLSPVGVIAEIVADDGDMMRLPGLIDMGAKHEIPVITIEALIHYLNAQHPET